MTQRALNQLPPETTAGELRLSQASLGRSYIMVDLDGGQMLKEKIYSMGLNPGVKFKIIANSGKGPLGLEVRQTKLAIGRGMAGKIKIREDKPPAREIVIALAGNPNSGKTTVFNNLTGANQHVGNYPGVTVEKKEGHLTHDGRRFKVVDLPGTYSLSTHSPEEIIARGVILADKPDVVIDIVDASNLERNLYLYMQLAELGVPVVIALNMSDMAKDRGIIIDHKHLSRLLGIPIVPTVGNKKKGMTELLDAAAAVAEGRLSGRPVMPSYGAELDSELGKISEIIGSDLSLTNGYRPRWLAIKLLEDDRDITQQLLQHASSEKLTASVEKSRQRLFQLFGDDPAAIFTDRRYGFISGACSESVKNTAERRHDISDMIDTILIHPIFGMLFFAFTMWLMFYLTFTLAEKPVELVELGVGALSGLFANILPEGILRSLVVDGIIAGVGGVIVFLPNIMILFLSIAVLEDTGYMARAAFVMDRVMHKIGLHGKSFIPMLIGFGCSVPAYMGSRIIEDKTDRLVTMHVTTFMSCGARLPVYVLICGAFWPAAAGHVMFSIYALGILTAIGMVKLLRLTRFKGTSAPFVIELPPYRVPTLRSLLLHMGERSLLYLRKAGGIILGISIIMWFLMTFPQRKNYTIDYDTAINGATSEFAAGNISEQAKDSIIAFCENLKAADNLEYSIAGKLGKLIEPVIAPLGFDWRLGIAVVSGFAAKEVIVSTMGTVYGVGKAADEGSATLRSRLATDPKYSRLAAYAFLVFILLYFPCMSAMAVFLKESGSTRELLFQVGYTTALAYIMTLIVYQGGKLLGLG